MRSLFALLVVALGSAAVASAQPIMGQQPGLMGAQPIMAQQPLYPNVGVQQPILGLGAAAQQPFYPTQPAWTGGVLGAQQPIALGATGFAGVPAQFAAGTIPTVLPQNYGNSPASFGSLGQPVLSPMQLQQVVPTAQLQAALNQRVAGFAPIGAAPQIGNGAMPGAF